MRISGNGGVGCDADPLGMAEEITENIPPEPPPVQPPAARPEIDQSWRAAILKDSVTVKPRDIRAEDKGRLGSAVERLGDGTVDDTALKMITKGLTSLGRSKEDMELDCSGFVKRLAQGAGENLQDSIDKSGPNGTTQMWRSFEAVPKEQASTGNLVFFNTTTKKEEDDAIAEGRRHDLDDKEATHVGLLIVNEDGTRSVLHMANSGVRLNSFSDTSNADGKSWEQAVIGYTKMPTATHHNTERTSS